MRRRIYGIKKSKILGVTLLLFLIIYFVFIALNVIFFKEYRTLWFYVFCLLVGLFEILKGRFFKLDSAFYLGAGLFLTGAGGGVSILSATEAFLSIYVLLAWVTASVLSCIICGQRFHLVIAYSLFFVLIFQLLQKLNLISFSISIAICLSFLLLLVVSALASFLKRLK